MEWLNIVYYVITPAVIMYAGHSMKSHLDRIEIIEKELVKKIDEPEVRTIIADKIDPMKEDIKEIKEMLNHILTVVMKKPD